MSVMRSVRVDEGLWDAAKVQAQRDGRTVTEVIVAALCVYTGRPEPEPPVFTVREPAVHTPEAAVHTPEPDVNTPEPDERTTAMRRAWLPQACPASVPNLLGARHSVGDAMSFPSQCELCGGRFASQSMPDIQVSLQATGETWDNVVIGTLVLCHGCTDKTVSDLMAAITMRQAIEHTRLSEDRRRRGLDS